MSSRDKSSVTTSQVEKDCRKFVARILAAPDHASSSVNGYIWNVSVVALDPPCEVHLCASSISHSICVSVTRSGLVEDQDEKMRRYTVPHEPTCASIGQYFGPQRCFRAESCQVRMIPTASHLVMQPRIAVGTCRMLDGPRSVWRYLSSLQSRSLATCEQASNVENSQAATRKQSSAQAMLGRNPIGCSSCFSHWSKHLKEE